VGKNELIDFIIDAIFDVNGVTILVLKMKNLGLSWVSLSVFFIFFLPDES